MELRQLRYFAKAAELLNFTRAAEKLRVAQPALSRQISGLEHELGVTLLERNSRRVVMTPAGRAFLEDVVEILDLVEAAEARVKRVQRGTHEILRVGFAPQLTGSLVTRLAQKLEAQGLKVRFDLRDMSNGEMVAGVRQRKLDLALLPTAAVPHRPDLVVTALASHRLEVILPGHHPLAQRKAVTLRDIAEERLLSYDKHQYSEYDSLLKGLYRQARMPLEIAAEYDGGSSLFAAVQSGAGVAIVASAMTKSVYPGVVSRPLQGSRLRVKIGLLHHALLAPRFAEPLHKICREIAELGDGLASDV